MADKKKSSKKKKGSKKENYDLFLTCTNCYQGFIGIEIQIGSKFKNQVDSKLCPHCGVMGEFTQRFKLNPYLQIVSD